MLTATQQPPNSSPLTHTHFHSSLPSTTHRLLPPNQLPTYPHHLHPIRLTPTDPHSPYLPHTYPAHVQSTQLTKPILISPSHHKHSPLTSTPNPASLPLHTTNLPYSPSSNPTHLHPT